MQHPGAAHIRSSLLPPGRDHLVVGAGATFLVPKLEADSGGWQSNKIREAWVPGTIFS